MRRVRTAVLAAALCTLFTVPASAWGFFDLSVGVKGGGGGDVWLSPNMPGGVSGNGTPFGEQRGGWHYGGGIFAEGRFLKFIGLEIDLLFEHHVLKEDMTYNGVVEVEHRLEWDTLRLPFLVKGVLPLGIARLWVGIGPEFVWRMNGDFKQKVTSGNATLGDAPSTKTGMDTYLTTGLGVTFAVWKLSIPIDLRFSYNFDQRDAYDDRATYDAATRVLQSFQAANQLDAKLMVGLAYEF